MRTTEPIISPGTTVAVTGASGFIGGRLVERLSEQGAIVTCLSRSAVLTERLAQTRANVCEINLADAQHVRTALEGVQYVFHCAFDAQDTAWNIAALQAMIDSCVTHMCQLIHLSSYVVYDLPITGELTEKMPPSPSNHGYAHTKLQLEQLLLEATRDRGLLGTILQPTIVYGPYSRPWTTEPAEMLRYGVVILPDQGEGLCNAVYVDDVVNAMILAAIQPSAVGERFLISGPEPVTWAAFYEQIAQSVDANRPAYRPAEMLQRSASRLNKILRLAGDPEEAIRRVSHVGPIHRLLPTLLALIPPRLRTPIKDRLERPASLRPGYVHMPNLAHLRFLQSQAAIHSAKAKAQLGYHPRYNFEAGMALTAPYLRHGHQAKPRPLQQTINHQAAQPR